jgi:integrase/recombinase XerD
MARVTLMMRVRCGDARPFVRPVATSGRLKPYWAVVNGKKEEHPEAVYYLRYTEGGKRRWEPVGQKIDEVMAAKLRRESFLKAKKLGLTVADDRQPEKRRITLADAVTEFVSETHQHKSRKTAQGREYNLNTFRAGCVKAYLDELDRGDLMHYMAVLRKQGLGERTVYNRVGGVVTFLRAYGIKGLLRANDWPKYTEKKVSAYTREEVKALLAAANAEERLIFEFFLGTGAREQEVQYACWADISFDDRTFTVKEKKDLGFKPKDAEERIVPIPDALVTALKARRKVYQDARLIFTNGQGGPEGHFLRRLKKIAFKAGLNCGQCYNKRGLCCKDHPVCDRWELHRWRKTFATLHHESGVSARTLQKWLGHSDLETTLCYLEAADARSEATRAAVNHTFAALA